MPYRVKDSHSAKTGADDAYAWMKEHHSEAQAIRWFNGLVDAADSLSELPRGCPVAPESDEIGFELRQLLYGKHSPTYRVVFTVTRDIFTNEDIVQVLRIWHSARDTIKSSDLDDE